MSFSLMAPSWKSRVQRLLIALSVLLGPGIPFVFIGHYRKAFIMYVIAVAFSMVVSYLAIYSAWVVVVATLLLLLFYIGSAIAAYALFPRRRSVGTAINIAIFAVTLALYAFVFEPLMRVKMYANPAHSMEPTVLSGDRFFVDRMASNFKVGDVVTVILPGEKITSLRRIKSINGSQVTFMTDNPTRTITNDGRLADIQGRALYSFFSFNPETKRFRSDRFLKDIR